MLAKKIKCTIEEVYWVTPSMLTIRFRTDRIFHFMPGQFISVQIPGTLKGSKPMKRLYSLVSSPEESQEAGVYELCIKYVPSGAGSEYFARSTKGDTFTAYAPYGDFFFRPDPQHAACFIGTGSGIAPIRSMILSKEFQAARPKKAICILGVRTEKERVFANDFKRAGVETVFAVSKPAADFTGFKGRVTDYLKKIMGEWDIQATDFYICGNGEMIIEVERSLRSAGVPVAQIHKEAFSSHNGQYKPRKVVPLRRKVDNENASDRDSALADTTTRKKN